MRFRITKTLVLLVLGALLITSVGTLVLISRATKRNAERDLADQATRISNLGENEGFNFVRNARRALDLQDAEILVIGPNGKINSLAANGTLEDGASLPNGLTINDLDLAALLNGKTIRGAHQRLAFAAAPINSKSKTATTDSTAVSNLSTRRQILRQQIQAALPDVTSANRFSVVVLTRQIGAGVAPAATYLLISAGIAFVLAIALGDRLARRISKPIHEARLVTNNIAQGHFEDRLTTPANADEEVVNLSASINSMAAALESNREAQRLFLMSISHDLRTPLTSIRGYAESITDEVADDPKAAARIIIHESQRLTRLVQDLLDLSKLESHQFTLKLMPCNVNSTINQTIDALTPRANELNLIFASDAQADLPLVKADPDRLQQCFTNVVENALKYAKREVRVSQSSSNNFVTISVRDDGDGIPDADINHVFERHFTSRPSDRAASTGLGLAIVKQLVEAMNGSVSAHNVTNSGAEIKMSLPAV